MRTIVIDLYTLDELSDKAQKKAIEAHDNVICIDSDWYQPTINHWKEELDKRGFGNADIMFSGFCSQGDGASFTADINLEKFLDKKYIHLMPHINEWSMSLTRNSTRYLHERTVGVSINDIHPQLGDSHKTIYNVIDTMIEDIESIRLEWCIKIYAALEKEHEFLSSEKYIREYIKGNEIEFKENGEIY